MEPIISAPPLQIMSLDADEKAAASVGVCGAVTCLAGSACLSVGMFSGIVPLIPAGGLVAASGAAIAFNIFKCEED
jgi:hypothetical protein